MKSISHDDATTASFRRDPELAAAYLNDVLADGDQEELMIALRRVSTAFGGVGEIAQQAELNAKTLYRTLSPKGNPELRSLTAILKAMGLRLAIEPLEHEDRTHAAV
jgi:probable addiction module antidote protein